MREVSEIFRELSSTSSRASKENILASNRDNEKFVKCLKFLLDPYIVTGISKQKIKKKLNLRLAATTVNDIEELMDYIAKSNTGRDEDIAVIHKFISSNADYKDFIEGLMTKSIRLGITAKTVNKVLGNVIREFNVMKSTNYEEVADNFNERAEKDGYAAYIKENGVRGEVIVRGDNVKIKSRQGLYVIGLKDIEDAFKNAPDGLYEGEIVTIENFANSNEQCQKTRSIYSSKGLKKGLKIKLFDYVSLYDMENCENDIKTIDRKTFIKNVCDKLNSDYVEYIEPLYIGKDVKMIDIKLKEVIEKGIEGLSCNILTAPYEFKRSKWAVKVKEFYTIDLKIIGIYEGTNKNLGKMGGMTVEYKDNFVDVGSGWTDEERVYYWENKERYIGRILEVKYKDETVNKCGKRSLQFPIRVCVREEGKEVSYE